MSLEIDYRAAKVCSLAHGETEGYRQAGYQNVTKIYGPETDTEAFVMEDDDYVYLVFRGTEVGEETSWKDIKTDLKFTRKGRVGDFMVHRGFEEALDEVGVDVAIAMDDVTQYHFFKPVILTGHSLGGALAVIAAEAFGEHIGFHLVTFGQPRVGGKKLNTYLEANLETYNRYVHLGDIVCRVPFLLGYKHGGNMRYLSHDGLIANPPFSLILKDNWSRLARRFTDHHMNNYLQGVEQAYLGVTE